MTKSSASRTSASAVASPSYAATQSRRAKAARARTRSSTVPTRPHPRYRTIRSSPPGGSRVGQRGNAGPRVDLPCEVLRVSAHAGEHHRREGVLEAQPAEVETGRGCHNAPILLRPAICLEDRQVDPVEDLLETGGPDDV